MRKQINELPLIDLLQKTKNDEQVDRKRGVNSFHNNDNELERESQANYRFTYRLKNLVARQAK